MDRIVENHWFVGEDSLGISFWKYYVQIKFFIHDKRLKYYMFIKDNLENSLLLEFNELSSAIRFAEEKIKNCETINKVVESYKDFKNNKTYKKTIR